MIRSAAVLFREQGYSGTGLRDVIAHSGAPRGSISHYFPGGKAQLAAEAVTWAGDLAAAGLADADDPAVALHDFLAFWRQTLRASDYRAGCPVAAVAGEAHADAPALIDATAAAFGSWIDVMARLLRGRGVRPARALRLSTLVVASIEGAITLSRAQRSTKSLDDVGKELEALLATV